MDYAKLNLSDESTVIHSDQWSANGECNVKKKVCLPLCPTVDQLVQHKRTDREDFLRPLPLLLNLPLFTILSPPRVLSLIVVITALFLYRALFKESGIKSSSIFKMTVSDSLDPASWRKQLDALPVGGRIPAFFFAHGCMNSPCTVPLFSGC